MTNCLFSAETMWRSLCCTLNVNAFVLFCFCFWYACAVVWNVCGQTLTFTNNDQDFTAGKRAFVWLKNLGLQCWGMCAHSTDDNHLFWLYLERPGTPQNFCEMWNLELAWFHELQHKPFKSEMIPWRRYRQMWNNSPQFQTHLALVMDGPSKIEKDTLFQRAYFGVLLI